jgi:hypothetical protein
VWLPLVQRWDSSEYKTEESFPNKIRSFVSHVSTDLSKFKYAPEIFFLTVRRSRTTFRKPIDQIFRSPSLLGQQNTARDIALKGAREANVFFHPRSHTRQFQSPNREAFFQEYAAIPEKRVRLNRGPVA